MDIRVNDRERERNRDSGDARRAGSTLLYVKGSSLSLQAWNFRVHITAANEAEHGEA